MGPRWEPLRQMRDHGRKVSGGSRCWCRTRSQYTTCGGSAMTTDSRSRCQWLDADNDRAAGESRIALPIPKVFGLRWRAWLAQWSKLNPAL